ncbi:DUF2167 domain-containing protein [Terrarubrum flagellatum]|uniref:DUF2167 domain-containing protein n=1 Tax=Terrirubrum flagellatum TaxID=2895980 RepID=UPI0031454D54
MRYFKPVLVVIFALLLAPVAAQTPPSAEQRAAERRAAFEAADKVAVRGAAVVKLGEQGEMALPGGYLYVPQPEAGRVTRSLGNSDSPNLLGLVFPRGDGNWFASLRFIKEGYIKDDDAKNWNADELLQNLKDGTEAGNSDRVSRGFDAMEVTRWLEVPLYDGVAHRLVWSALVKTKGSADNDGSANYNTYALGREGYLSLNLVTGVDSLEGNKKFARELLAALNYGPGKRYEDFNASTDSVAAYGLAALVGGAVAKKIGAFALIAAFALKAWKLIIVAAAGLLYGVGRLFGRKPRADA